MDRLLWWGLRLGAQFSALAGLYALMRYLAEADPVHAFPAIAGFSLALVLWITAWSAGVPEGGAASPRKGGRS